AAQWVRPISQIFLRLIKMIIAPLIFASLVAGIAGAGQLRTVGRMGLRALLLFELLTTLALAIGLVAVNLTRPGAGVDLPAAAAMAYTVGHGGLGVLWHLGALVLTLYAALFVFIVAVLVPSALLFRIPLREFGRAVKEPAIIAFSTTSSEAALPRAMEKLEAYGVPRPIVAFILPFGYSFNLCGSALYLSLAAVFVAQAANVHLTIGQQIT